MKSIFRPLVLLFALAALMVGGCSSAYTGLRGASMYSDGLADIVITPLSGLEPVAYGSYVSTMLSDAMIDPGVRIRYAIYGDPGGQNVRRHAHIIFAELTDKKRFTLEAETFAKPNELSLRGVKLDRRNWTEHVFYEQRQGDWFTEFWDMNGYVTPQVWLGKRWSHSYDQTSRVVLEYREPLPDCAKVYDRKVAVVLNDVTIDMPTPECRREVEAVLDRADQAFSMRRPANVKATSPAPAELLPAKPGRYMDIQRYVGEASMDSKHVDDD